MVTVAGTSAPLNVAPGSVVTVRDADWLVTNATPTRDGLLVEVTGLSELVRDTRAAFYEHLDEIVPYDQTRPLVGRVVPAIIFRSVDLPAPLRPSSATDAPVGNTALMLSATTCELRCRLKTLVRFCRTIMSSCHRGRCSSPQRRSRML